MIRFCDKEAGYAEYDLLDRSELLSYFFSGHMDEIVCVFDDSELCRYRGKITYYSLIGCQNVYDAIQDEYIIFDENIWMEGRKFFINNAGALGETLMLPVLNKDGQLLCFAYEDFAADRQLRMLRELEQFSEILDFRKLFPEYKGVTIYDCNELAYFFALYLKKQGIPVNVWGGYWKNLGEWEHYEVPDHCIYNLYAEGIRPKSKDSLYDGLRSVSVEFECIDQIYERGIREGLIKEAGGDFDWLLDKLRDKEVVIIGTGVESQSAYDLVLGKGIDICCFLSDNKLDQRYQLLGKPVLSGIEIRKRYRDPVFLECTSEHSAWGFGNADQYDCAGYYRNESYFLLKDYTEIPVSSLLNVIKKKNVILIGNIRLCYHVKRILEKAEQCSIFYLDVLKEAGLNRESGIELADCKRMHEKDICLLVEPRYFGMENFLKRRKQKRDVYLKKAQEYGVDNISDYFSKGEVLSRIQDKNQRKYTVPQLTPGKLLLGAIGHMSGNFFFRGIMDGHPNVVSLDFGLLEDNLFFLLAEEKAGDIQRVFWEIYDEMTGTEEDVSQTFPQKELFDEKFCQLLSYGESFTPQELFVIIHLAYVRMWETDIADAGNILIYWEPHEVPKKQIEDYQDWLGSENVKGALIDITRNSYTRVGSFLKFCESTQLPSPARFLDGLWYNMGYPDMEVRPVEGWKKIEVAFEKLKTSPREVLTYICEESGIMWSDTLLQTTHHGESQAYVFGNDRIKDFDLKPVHNLYEEYFSEFDRLRISMIFSSLQKRWGYPYVSCMDFTRRQLQDMFLKPFRFESRLLFENIHERQRYYRKLLWKVDECFQKIRREEMR